MGEQLGFADLKASRKIAKNILKPIEEKVKAEKKLSVKERLVLKRSKELKGKVSDDDRLALTQWANEKPRGEAHSLKVGQFLEWIKKPWKQIKNEDVYDYLNNVVLARESKNKLTGEDTAPFSNFGKWSKGEWVNQNRVEGISYTEANLLRYVPVELREVSKGLVSRL